MNKFEALKQFMAWPRECQELCGEYWAQADQHGPVVALPRPKAEAKVAAVRHKHHSRLAWSAAEAEYLLKLTSDDLPLCSVVDCFLRKYPGRSGDAVRRRVWGIRIGKPESEVKY
jgi:hypothetical protein